MPLSVSSGKLRPARCRALQRDSGELVIDRQRPVPDVVIANLISMGGDILRCGRQFARRRYPSISGGNCDLCISAAVLRENAMGLIAIAH